MQKRNPALSLRFLSEALLLATRFPSTFLALILPMHGTFEQDEIGPIGHKNSGLYLQQL